MGKTLTETAKAILMNEGGNYPSVKSDPARGLKGEDKPTENAKTLAPGSKTKEDRFSTPGSTPPKGEVKDLGAAVTFPTDKNGIFDSAVGEKSPKRPADKDGGEKTPVKQGSSNVKEEVDEIINSMIEEGKSEEEILAALEEEFGADVISELFEEAEIDEDEELVEEEAEPTAQFEISLDEHIEALFAGEELSEEFKEKAKTIFEAAINEKLKIELETIEAAYAEQLEEEVTAVKTELSESVDKYLNYVVEQWVEDNQVAIESNLKSEIVEDFMGGLKSLFEQNYLDIPDDKVQVVEEMAAKIEELEAKLNEEIEANVELLQAVTEAKANEIFAEMTDDLTATEAERLASLAEGVEFTSPEEYASKLSILKEKYFSANKSTTKVLDEQTISDPERDLIESVQGPMALYLKTLGKVKN
jgi:putative sterol carrier protein